MPKNKKKKTLKGRQRKIVKKLRIKEILFKRILNYYNFTDQEKSCTVLYMIMSTI